MSRVTDHINKKTAESEEFNRAYLEAKTYNDFTDLLFNLKLESGLTATEFANKVNKNRSTLNRIESQKMEPSLTLMNEIANTFGKEIKVSLLDKVETKEESHSR